MTFLDIYLKNYQEQNAAMHACMPHTQKMNNEQKETIHSFHRLSQHKNIISIIKNTTKVSFHYYPYRNLSKLYSSDSVHTCSVVSGILNNTEIQK